MASQTQERYEDDRLAQVAIKAGLLYQLAPTWDILDYDRIDETFVPWAQASMAVIRPWRQASADQAVASYTSDRRLYVPPRLADTPGPRVEFSNSRDTSTSPSPTLGRAPTRRTRNIDNVVSVDWAGADRAAERSLLVTGPGELKKQVKRGVLREQALEKAKAKVFAAAARQVLNGGRDVTQDMVDADEAALGWVRVTDGDPCAFCALLSSRGPVYKTEGTASFSAHDDCACIAKPVFSRKAPWPGRAREFRALYDEKVFGKFGGTTPGFKMPDGVRAFRRFYEAEQRERAKKREVAA